MNADDLALTLRDFEVNEHPVVVHASLRSFGHFQGGAEGVVSVLKRDLKTVLMPAFSTDSVTLPPLDDRPMQNGCDYGDTSFWKLNSSKPFNIELQSVDPRMGRIAQVFATSAGVRRSPHPWHSWAAFGDGSESIVGKHSWECPHEPLQRLLDRRASVLLIGVDLTSCTAIHLAEDRAGRRPFVRWALDTDSSVRRIAVAGCAAGFGNLMPHLEDLFVQKRLGPCRLMVAPLDALVTRAAAVIGSEPEITRCSSDCLRCNDAILGGPKE